MRSTASVPALIGILCLYPMRGTRPFLETGPQRLKAECQMNILFCYRGIDNIVGGVERTSVELMNEMFARGHHIEFLTWDRPDGRSYFPLDPRIVWHKVGNGNFQGKAKPQIRLARAKTVRALVGKIRPDLIIAYQVDMYMAIRLYLLGMRNPVVAAECSSPSRYFKNKLAARLIFQSFRLARAITVLCESYRGLYPPYLRHKIVTIPHPVHATDCSASPAGEIGKPKILLFVGRLSYPKQVAVLIRAFIRIARDFPDWNLLVIGEGEDRSALENIVAQSGLAERIQMPGAKKDVAEIYGASHLFCLPSQWEGFPIALTEAMAQGLPAVGFAEGDGVNELILPGRTGLLANGNGNIESLASALAELMADDTERVRMGQEARRMVASFEPGKVFDRWEEFFRSFVK